MRKSVTALAGSLVAAVLLLGLSTQASQAQGAAFGAQASWGSESDFGLGASAFVNIPDLPLEAVGSFNYFFPGDDMDWWEVNANAFYHFEIADAPNVRPYVGGGLNIVRWSVDVGEVFSESGTEVGLNIGGGVRFPGETLTPFIEGRAVISDADQVVLTGGILFGRTRR